MKWNCMKNQAFSSPSPVDLAFVVDFDFDFDLAADRAETTKLSLFRVIMRSVELRVVGRQLDRGDDQMILLVR